MNIKDVYLKKLQGLAEAPSLINHPLLNHCYTKYKHRLLYPYKASCILYEQKWTDYLWSNDHRLTTPKHIYHVDFDLFMEKEYLALLNKLISNAQQDFRNIVTSITLDAFQSTEYYTSWCKRLDTFLVNNERKQVFDYLNIYIAANEVELADLWLNTPIYSSYSNVFDVVRMCSSIANLTKVNVMYIKKTSRKTGRPIYDNILKSRMDLGWPLNLCNKHHELSSKITLIMLDNGRTAYIKNIHMSDAEIEGVVDYIEKYWKNRTFDAIEFDTRMVKLNNDTAVKVGTNRYRIKIKPPPSTTLASRLSALLPWLRSYVSQ
jgi:hypothetical protein